MLGLKLNYVSKRGPCRKGGMSTVGTQCHVQRLTHLPPGQNDRRFADDMLKRIFLNESIWISSKISLRHVPWGIIDNLRALVQIMAWRSCTGLVTFCTFHSIKNDTKYDIYHIRSSQRASIRIAMSDIFIFTLPISDMKIPHIELLL